MRVTETAVAGVAVIEPEVFDDQRGFFFESWNDQVFRSVVADVAFVQDNHSRSALGVVRGLHYQVVRPQGKLVRVTAGAAFDVAVDIRSGSPTFRAWVGEVLSAENKRQLWIPPGFAHGFLSLEDDTEVLYKATDFYVPEYDRALHWSDPEIGVEWPSMEAYVVSPRDASAPTLAQADLDHTMEG